MRILIVSILIIVFNLPSIGQDTTKVTTIPQDTLVKKYKKVMIIPFEADMYVCGIQPYLAATSGKTHLEIVDFFRKSVALEVQNKFLYTYNTASLIHHTDTNKDIFKAYDAVKYKFEIAPVEEEKKEEEKTLDKAKNLFKTKKKAKKYERGTVKDGNIVSVKNTEQKFANVVVTKKENLKFLSVKYKADLFVYITELDIENDISNQTAFINNDYERFIRLHYSMVDKEGNVVEKGVVSTKFPNNINDINVIKSTYLPILAQKLANKLPQPEKPKVDKKKAVNVTEKIKN